ncbi:MAG: PH domain-containing protein [Marinicaulis sp.]|nr:PH domain-containing protein [Marinicaulis sp.]NNE39412.1 PH domain-containing protein [Marinicaulis sp.]NNL88787.1 PH domain-containing protein [Marinicaulis sp.]
MSGYVDKTLAGGEEVIHRANFNWTYSFFPVFWFASGAAALAMFFFIQFAAEVPYEELRVGWWSAIIGGVAGSIILINHLIILATTEIVVTTYRFVYKTGLISRHTQEVSLNKIEEITLEQSVWGRILGFGQLVLRGTGVGVITLPDLDDPIRLRKIIENAKSALRLDQRERRRINEDDDDF